METVDVTVIGVNEVPVARTLGAATSADRALALSAGAGLLASARDIDAGDTLSVTAINGQARSVGQRITLPSGALLTPQADGTWSYDPNSAFGHLGEGAVGDRQLHLYDHRPFRSQFDRDGRHPDPRRRRFSSRDGDPGTGEKEVPTGSSASGLLSGADRHRQRRRTARGRCQRSDQCGRPEVILPSGALLTVRTWLLRLRPNGAFPLATGRIATDSFTFTVSDRHGGTATATATITVVGANDAPVAKADAISFAEGGTIQVPQLACWPTIWMPTRGMP